MLRGEGGSEHGMGCCVPLCSVVEGGDGWLHGSVSTESPVLTSVLNEIVSSEMR